MKELITVTLGPLSNFTAAHFWNFQDEWFKQEPLNPDGTAPTIDRNVVLYYETQKSRQFVPRSIFVDFQSHFGNYLSCFSHPKPGKEEGAQQWGGSVRVSESEPVRQSDFQRELDTLETIYEEGGARKGAYEEEMEYEGEEDDDDVDPRDRFKDIMQGYKSATGGSQSSADYLMQLMMQQMQKPGKGPDEMIDTTSKRIDDAPP
jgi:hypothetical protein